MKAVLTLAKVMIVAALASLSFSAFAGSIYVGNPNRPNTVWIPAHYSHGYWVQGYYVKYINPPVSCRNLTWVNSGVDKHGYYVPAHYEPRYTRIVASY